MMGAGTLAGDSVTFAEEGFPEGHKGQRPRDAGREGPRKLFHKFEIEQGHGYQVIAEDTCMSRRAASEPGALRHTSPTERPCPICLRAYVICSTENLDFRIAWSFPGLQ